MTDNPTKARTPAAARRSPIRLLTTIVAGLLVGSALYGGYMYWTHQKAQQPLVDAPGDEDMAKPAVEECAIARAGHDEGTRPDAVGTLPR